MIKLDHVVYFTRKTPSEIVKEQKLKNQHTVIGGSHENWGTYNALMYVNNAYLEWISIENQEIAKKTKHPLIEQLVIDEDGWGTICLAVTGIDAFNEKLIAKGVETFGVSKSERRTVDGKIRKWKMVNIKQQITDNLPLPLFIEWEETDEQRIAILREDRSLVPENEKLEIKECIFSVDNPEKEAGKWADLLSVERSENRVLLPNAVLQFIQKKDVQNKERLSDVLLKEVK